MTKAKVAEAKRRAEENIAELLRRGVHLSKSDRRAIHGGQTRMVEMERAGTPWSPEDMVIVSERVGEIVSPRMGEIITPRMGKIA